MTGAAGRTGKLILEKLLEHNFFSGFGLVHSKQVDFFRRSMSLPPILEGRLQVAFPLRLSSDAGQLALTFCQLAWFGSVMYT